MTPASNRRPEGDTDPTTLDPEAPSYIVGIGASAGGLEALERLLKAMAFVVIQHLSPDFRSLMDELLARHTSMAIRRVDEPTTVARNTVYLLPPRKEMTIVGRTLEVQDRPLDQALSLPINLFFRSLAREATDRAVAIVLSGTGTDGSAGLIDIHELGGLVLVQSEETAKFGGMPRSAIDTGLVDAVLSPEEMPAVLLAYARNPAAPLLAQRSDLLGAEPLAGMPLIIDRLRDAYGIDFNQYKPATISRRIDRRLALGDYTSLQAYVERVSTDPNELELLYKDLLIGVTRFFRDPEAYEILQTQIIPALVEAAAPDDEIRIWVPGCATGEEPYSLAILFHEYLQQTRRQTTIRIFASDVHRESLHIASEGLYPEASLEEMSPERRARFFVREGRSYRVHSDLRRTLIFSPQNLIKDPPFTKMDLVSCRNVLIYFQPQAQLRALSAFHFALKLNGVLVLGPSEGPGDLAAEFAVVDRQWKVYRKIRDTRLPLDLRLNLSPGLVRSPSRLLLPGDLRLSRAYETLLNRYVPTGVLINEQREVMHVFGDADHFLRTPTGRMTQDIVGMVRGDLRIALASAIQSAVKRGEKVIFKGVRLQDREGRGEAAISLTVDPLYDKATGSTFMYVLFQEERRLTPPEVETAEEFEAGVETEERVQQLEHELQHTKESLQSTVEELETSNEELQSSNEELLAANEELQSTNEELHSVNEELYSV
ncbi:MAG TPA: CheR family methyltransferase, partial [Anaerolineales bacterium]|nr:CheR family methyltransferase [Anaerolineales bacterium]